MDNKNDPPEDPTSPKPPSPSPDSGDRPPSPPPKGTGGQPPDLEELWRDFNKRISNLLGRGKRSAGSRSIFSATSKKPQDPEQGGGGRQDDRNDMQTAGNPLPLPLFAMVLAVGLLLWLASGIFVVREGQQGVITQFGRYHGTVGAGLNWRLPYPFQADEVVNASQIRTVEVGSDKMVSSTGLRDAAMLTSDENIVEVKFSVQYRLKDTRAYLFETIEPDVAVAQAAESAVREVAGKMKMDEVLSNRSVIAPRVQILMQGMLDRYGVGVDVSAINLSQDGVRPPEQVKAAFDEVLRANQEAERAKNEAQAHASVVIPGARGTANRLMAEAQGYAAKVELQARGDTARFEAIWPEYKKSPQAVRDRMYIDTMQLVYGNTTKILVDARQGMLYLPLDKILQQTAKDGTAAIVSGQESNSQGAASAGPALSNKAQDPRMSDTRTQSTRGVSR